MQDGGFQVQLRVSGAGPMTQVRVPGEGLWEQRLGCRTRDEQMQGEDVRCRRRSGMEWQDEGRSSPAAIPSWGFAAHPPSGRQNLAAWSHLSTRCAGAVVKGGEPSPLPLRLAGLGILHPTCSGWDWEGAGRDGAGPVLPRKSF